MALGNRPERNHTGVVCVTGDSVWFQVWRHIRGHTVERNHFPTRYVIIGVSTELPGNVWFLICGRTPAKSHSYATCVTTPESHTWHMTWLFRHSVRTLSFPNTWKSTLVWSRAPAVRVTTEVHRNGTWIVACKVDTCVRNHTVVMSVVESSNWPNMAELWWTMY